MQRAQGPGHGEGSRASVSSSDDDATSPVTLPTDIHCEIIFSCVIHEKIVFGILKDSSGQNELMLYSSSNE